MGTSVSANTSGPLDAQSNVVKGSYARITQLVDAHSNVLLKKTKEILQRITRLCEVPEYQLRLPWHNEGDVIIFDNYALCHRVVADFYDIPAESRLLENIGTKGYPSAHDVLVQNVGIDASRNPHHDHAPRGRGDYGTARYFDDPGRQSQGQNSRL